FLLRGRVPGPEPVEDRLEGLRAGQLGHGHTPGVRSEWILPLRPRRRNDECPTNAPPMTKEESGGCLPFVIGGALVGHSSFSLPPSPRRRRSEVCDGETTEPLHGRRR